MAKFVIWNVDEQKYVAPAGSTHSFTKYLQHARVFKSRETAQSECCDNEFPRSADDEGGVYDWNESKCFTLHEYGTGPRAKEAAVKFAAEQIAKLHGLVESKGIGNGRLQMADLESWRFDLVLAEIEAALMDDAELQKQFGKHLNYIPGSSYTLVYFHEMERRGLVELLCAGRVEPCAEKAGV